MLKLKVTLLSRQNSASTKPLDNFFKKVLLTMPPKSITVADIRNDITINKTGELVWGRKRLQHVVYKCSVVRSVLDIEPLNNNSKKQ